nr:MAG TPA: hypothetical protein [Siphoviridae sp. ctEfY6]
MTFKEFKVLLEVPGVLFSVLIIRNLPRKRATNVTGTETFS